MQTGTLPRSWRDDRAALLVRQLAEGWLVDARSIPIRSAHSSRFSTHLLVGGYAPFTTGALRSSGRALTSLIADIVHDASLDDGHPLRKQVRRLVVPSVLARPCRKRPHGHRHRTNYARQPRLPHRDAPLRYPRVLEMRPPEGTPGSHSQVATGRSSVCRCDGQLLKRAIHSDACAARQL